MTSVLEKVVASIAPHHCLVCSVPNNIICDVCVLELPILENLLCCLCGRPTTDWRVCAPHAAPLEYIWPCFLHEGVCAKAIYAFKYERVRAAAAVFAAQLDAQLPYLPDWLVVPLPTAPTRARRRGYDQSVLLAKAFAKRRNLPSKALLGRLHDNQQVGAARAARRKQAKDMFYLKKAKVEGRNILLIDDVCTTGASLVAAATLLKRAGAQRVAAGVVAWSPKKR